MAKTSVVVIQSCFMVFIFALTFVSGLLPIWLPWFKNHKILRCIANAFSGGVFLSLAIMHMLPETSEKYDEWKGEEEHDEHEEEEEEEHDHDHSFSLPFTLVFVGYAFILFIDKVLFDTHQLHGDGHHHDETKKESPSSEGLKKDAPDNVYENSAEPAQIPEDEEAPGRNQVFAQKMSGILQEDSKNAEAENAIVSKNDDKEMQDIQATDGKMNEEGGEETEAKFNKMNLFSFAAITLMIGLGAHSLFEGIVIGLEDETREVWSLVLAITSHKWAAAISLGINLHNHLGDQHLLIAGLIAFFSLSTPIGVGIGMIVSGESDLTEVIFNALAAGIFIYVACSEIISEEFGKPKYKWFKMGSFIVGAGFILGINQIEF